MVYTPLCMTIIMGSIYRNDMAISVNEDGVVKSITIDVPPFISAIDLIAEDLQFTKSTSEYISLDHDYRFLIIIHTLRELQGSNYFARIGSQLIDLKGLKSIPNTSIRLSSVIYLEQQSSYIEDGYSVKCDSTGRQITITAGRVIVQCPKITILGVR